MEAIANTSIGLQPQQQPSSPLAEAIGEAEAVINDATSYIAQAASRVGRAATGLASAVTQALSPASTNAELPAEVPADSPISPAGSSIPRSPNVDLPNAEPYPLMSPSAASTATFDTAFESAEEGSIDSATFETFETLSTLSPSTSVYTPTIPPPQASLPDLSEHSPMRVRRGSMPASLSGTAARRRLASTPTGGLAADDDDDHIPRNLDRASPVMGPVPIRRPYTGRSATLPPPQATQVPLAALVTDPQRYEAMMVANGTLAGRFVGSPIPLSDMMSPVSIPADSRPDSPLDLQMPGTFSPLALAASPFVVPFPADGEPELPSSPRSPTAVIDYSPTAAARERTRRDSGISSAVGGLGFARQGPIATVGGIPVSQTVTRGGAPVVYEQAPNRNSLPTVVDYSVRSPRGSIGAELALWSDVTGMTGMTGPQVLGADVDANTQAQACAPAEVTETLVDQHADVDPEESFQLDSSSCHSSSASDELDAAPCTPRTPELDHLANVTAGGVTPTQQRKSSASVVRESPPSAKTIRATGAPFRAMHYDMSQSSDDANDSFATANSNVL
jgi:hypothetical protein